MRGKFMIDNSLLYFVSLDNNFPLLALEVSLKTEENQIILTFYDTNRGRMFYGNVVEEKENGFTFITENKQIMEFEVATVAEYNNKWRSNVEGTIPDFQSDTELHQWYIEQFLN